MALLVTVGAAPTARKLALSEGTINSLQSREKLSGSASDVSSRACRWRRLRTLLLPQRPTTPSDPRRLPASGRERVAMIGAWICTEATPMWARDHRLSIGG
jgi:hypothetical protein